MRRTSLATGSSISQRLQVVRLGKMSVQRVAARCSTPATGSSRGRNGLEGMATAKAAITRGPKIIR